MSNNAEKMTAARTAWMAATKQVEVRLYADDWCPVYDFSSKLSASKIIVPEAVLERWKQAFKEFLAVQHDMHARIEAAYPQEEI